MDNRTSKPSATEQVYEALRGRISSGEWRPGERLPSESELAASFGVNRLTVRMALQKLAALGVTETRTGSGTYVLDFDLDGCLRAVSGFALRGLERKHLTEFRNHMEIECARLACERAAPEELDELARLAAEHRRAWLDDSAEHELWCRRVAGADLAFHEQVVRMSHNPLYISAFAIAREPLYAYMLESVGKWSREMLAEFRLAASRDTHLCICEAIRARDFAACQSNYAAMVTSYTRPNRPGAEALA